MIGDPGQQIHIAEQRLREHGAPANPADLAPYLEEMRELWREGFDTLEIAQALGLSEAQVYNGRKYFALHPVALPDAAAEGEGR